MKACLQWIYSSVPEKINFYNYYNRMRSLHQYFLSRGFICLFDWSQFPFLSHLSCHHHLCHVLIALLIFCHFLCTHIHLPLFWGDHYILQHFLFCYIVMAKLFHYFGYWTFNLTPWTIPCLFYPFLVPSYLGVCTNLSPSQPSQFNIKWIPLTLMCIVDISHENVLYLYFKVA